MIRSYTSREESERLLELRIDEDTADLVYVSDLSYPSVLPGVSYSYAKARIEGTTLPSWTTDTLLNILPTRINNEYQLIIFTDPNTEMWVCMYDKIGTHDSNLEATGDQSYHKAIWKMVVWFLENKISEEL